MIFLPELAYVWKAYPLHFSLMDFPQLVAMVVILPAFFHCIQYTHEMKQDEFMNIVFGMLAVLFFMILYSLTFWLLVIILLITYVFFHFHYYEFEKTNNNLDKKA